MITKELEIVFNDSKLAVAVVFNDNKLAVTDSEHKKSPASSNQLLTRLGLCLFMLSTEQTGQDVYAASLANVPVLNTRSAMGRTISYVCMNERCML